MILLSRGRTDVATRLLGVSFPQSEMGPETGAGRSCTPSFAQLQYDPQGVWLTGHIAVQNLSPIMADDERSSTELRRSASAR